MSIKVLYDQYDKLTEAERAYLRSYPMDAPLIWQAREFALAETIRLFGRNGRNDRSDAFRHCLWSAILARDIGSFHALRFSTAHELLATNPAAERTMDLHNNAIGLRIGASKASNARISQQCMAALNTGELKILKVEVR